MFWLDYRHVPSCHISVCLHLLLLPRQAPQKWPAPRNSMKSQGALWSLSFYHEVDASTNPSNMDQQCDCSSPAKLLWTAEKRLPTYLQNMKTIKHIKKVDQQLMILFSKIFHYYLIVYIHNTYISHLITAITLVIISQPFSGTPSMPWHQDLKDSLCSSQSKCLILLWETWHASTSPQQNKAVEKKAVENHRKCSEMVW